MMTGRAAARPFFLPAILTRVPCGQVAIIVAALVSRHEFRIFDARLPVRGVNALVSSSLEGKFIALPETRQLDILVGLLERRGARVWQCPLVAIHDAPDPAPVEQWLRLFIARPPDDLVLLTGEGLRRLLGFAERAGLRDDFVAALARTRRITRGPKPARALREIGLQADVPAGTPTTDGVIDTLRDLGIEGRDVAVQLYGTDPNTPLMEFLAGQGVSPRVVAPYVYASQSDDGDVVAVIKAMAAGELDAIAFTSQPQVRRLWRVAATHQLETALRDGLARTVVAAVGPVVAAALEEQGVAVQVMPTSSYFMKPLVAELERALAAAADVSGD